MFENFFEIMLKRIFKIIIKIMKTNVLKMMKNVIINKTIIEIITNFLKIRLTQFY